MSKHIWVNFTYTPVEVEEQEGGILHTFTSELSEEVARDDGQLICYMCGTALTLTSFNTPCEPEETPQN